MAKVLIIKDADFSTNAIAQYSSRLQIICDSILYGKTAYIGTNNPSATLSVNGGGCTINGNILTIPDNCVNELVTITATLDGAFVTKQVRAYGVNIICFDGAIALGTTRLWALVKNGTDNRMLVAAYSAEQPNPYDWGTNTPQSALTKYPNYADYTPIEIPKNVNHISVNGGSTLNVILSVITFDDVALLDTSWASSASWDRAEAYADAPLYFKVSVRKTDNSVFTEAEKNATLSHLTITLS